MLRARHPFQYALLAAAIAIAGLYIFTGLMIYKYGAYRRVLGWESAQHQVDARIVSVDPGGPAAGKLKTGDRILSINGEKRYLTMSLTWGPRVFIPPGGSYRIRVLRAAGEKEFELTTPLVLDHHQHSAILLLLMASMISFLVACVVGYHRPDERPPRLFALTWLSVAAIQLTSVLATMEVSFTEREMLFAFLTWVIAFSPMEIALAYHFGYRFPSGLKPGRFWSALIYAFYFAAGSLTLFYTVARILLIHDYRSSVVALQTLPIFAFTEKAAEVLMLSGMVAIGAVMARNYRLVVDADQRRRIHWVVFGSIVGILPMIAFFAMTMLLGKPTSAEHPLLASIIEGLFGIGTLFLSIIPVTMGLAVARHRMFGIDVVLRRGIQYLLARNVLLVLTYLPAALLVLAFLANPHQTLGELFFDNKRYLVLAVVAYLFLRYRSRFFEALDRKFFRDAYHTDRILLGMTDEIKNFSSITEVTSWVRGQLDVALHPSQVLFFYRRRDRTGLTPGFTSDEGDRRTGLTIPENAAFARILESEGKARETRFFERMDIPRAEKNLLKELKVALLVPMLDSEQKAVGLLMLGEKKSEEPYSAQDRKMLQSLTGQMGMLYENLLLKERVDRELRLKREVLDHLRQEKRNLVKECPACGNCYDSADEKCAKDGEELVLSLPVERVVDEKYRLERIIGRGGMGAVYEATDLKLKRKVAIKVLLGSRFGDRQSIRRFQREARASAQLNHPNIITVHDFGEIEGQGAYLVMELLPGRTLRTCLQTSGVIPPDQLAAIFDQMLDGLKAAHRLGIVHRDLKPENILVADLDGGKLLVKILDFGLAKIEHAPETPDTGSLTATGTVVGTLHYMSPEQLLGTQVDARSDIYSLGVMLVECLTGHFPFRGSTTTELAVAALQGSFRLRGDSQEIVRLNACLQKCLAKSPANRYAAAADMQVDLLPALRNLPPGAFAGEED